MRNHIIHISSSCKIFSSLIGPVPVQSYYYKSVFEWSCCISVEFCGNVFAELDFTSQIFVFYYLTSDWQTKYLTWE